MVVGRAVIFLAHLRAMTQMKAADWIHIVNGDQSRTTELIADIQESIEEHLSTYARDVEFKITITPDDDAQPQPDDLDDSD